MNITFYGCSLVETSTGPGGLMVYVILCPGAPKGSTSSGPGLKCLRRRARDIDSTAHHKILFIQKGHFKDFISFFSCCLGVFSPLETTTL